MRTQGLFGARQRGLVALGWLVAGAVGAASLMPRDGGRAHASSPGVAAALAPAASSPEVASARSLSKAFAQVAAQLRPAVVTIRIEKEVVAPHGLFGLPGGGGIQRGVGSGVLIDHKGHVVTNQHVVDGAREVMVQTSDGRELRGTVIGSDDKSDLAVVGVEGLSGIQPASFGDSDRLEVGEWVLALGAPFDLDQTVTAGIVSAKGRSKIRPQSYSYEDYVQTDAAVNPGNSGGPLVNLDGQVVGINTMIASHTGQFAGVSFAVSSNVARRVAQALIADGRVRRPYIGVALQELGPDLRKSFGVPRGGALVAQVIADSPAEKGGVQPGDVITSIDGHAVDGQEAVIRTIQDRPIGQALRLDVLRGGKSVRVTVTSAELKEQAEALARGAAHGPRGYGLQLQDLDPQVASQLGMRGRRGAVVADVAQGSPAARAGISEGDVIVEVDRKAVATAAEVVKLLRAGKGPHLLRLQTRGGARYVALKE